MQKKEQMLKLTPPDKISFRPPFNSVSNSELLLQNPTRQTLAFKIKTTAPKRYCVRPNAGIVEPNDEAEVQVMLQPGSIEERHKFQIQSIIVPDINIQELSKEELAKKLNSLWSDSSNTVMCSKLTCEFVTQAQEEKPKPEGDAPPEYSSVAPPAAEIKTEAVHQHQQQIAKEQPPKPAIKKADPMPSTASNTEGEEIRRLKAELQEALKKIELLSSTVQPSHSEQSAEQQKNLLIYLFIAFMLGFFISALI